MLSRLTSSWMDDRTVTTVHRASWLSLMRWRTWSTSCLVLSSSLALFCTCCRRTSSIRSVRWIASSCGMDISWTCALPPPPRLAPPLPPGFEVAHPGMLRATRVWRLAGSLGRSEGRRLWPPPPPDRRVCFELIPSKRVDGWIPPSIL